MRTVPYPADQRWAGTLPVLAVGCSDPSGYRQSWRLDQRDGLGGPDPYGTGLPETKSRGKTAVLFTTCGGVDILQVNV